MLSFAGQLVTRPLDLDISLRVTSQDSNRANNRMRLLCGRDAAGLLGALIKRLLRDARSPVAATGY